MKRSTLISFVAALAILGLVDAWYLADAALTGGALTCNIEGLSGCNVVAQSAYSHLFGVPLGLYGVVFYAFLLLAAIAASFRPERGMFRIIAVLAAAGALASVAFLYIQIALIKAICIYCLGSALIAFLLCLPAYRLTRLETSLSSHPSPDAPRGIIGP